MKRVLLALVSAAAITAACSSDDEDVEKKSWTACQASDQALVRRSFLAVSGRLPYGQAEVNVYEDVVKGLRKAGLSDRDVRTGLVELLSRDEAYLKRWADFFLDSLHIPRRITSSYFGGLAKDCFGPVGVAESPKVAEWVRDHSPLEPNPETANFTVGRLLTSSLLIDDLSPYYRAGLFQLMTTAVPGMNVEPTKLEWTRRKTLGESFQEVFLNRNVTCLKCHNSEFSITYDSDPALNRAWPLPGYYELALYGDSAAEVDPMQFYSVFRHSDVTPGAGAPWSWSSKSCSGFDVPEGDDPLGYEIAYGSIKSTPERPTLGKRASIWNLEYALHRGIDTAAQAGAITRDPDDPNVVADPDQALAALVAATVAEDVWEEAIGSRLTIANHFPRTQAARDTLERLRDTFLFSHFSLRKLLAEIVSDPVFNLLPPSSNCGSEPYPLPRILDPWTDREADPAARGNSVGDAVYPRSPRSLTRSLHTLMGWPLLADFPQGGEGDFEAALGFFLSSSEPGVRGVGVETRLVWEDHYSRCDLGDDDFVSDLLARATSTGSTLEDTVIALKDRLINEPWLDENERAPIEAVLGASLGDGVKPEHEAGLRLACGAYIASPQFLLGGLPARDVRNVPALTKTEDGYDAVCNALSLRISGANVNWSIECLPGSLRVRLD